MDVKTIKKAMRYLAKIDDDIAKAYDILGDPEPRIRPPGFRTFLSTIVSQQISTQAAKAIMGRVEALMKKVDAHNLLIIADEDLRAAGLSFRKIEYAKGLAKAIDDKSFDIDALESMSTDDAVNSITRLRGFGVWTAEIYLMFSQQRADIFPADDLALQVALQKLKGLEKKPTPKVARELAADWQPWRSVAALFLWHYYRGLPDA